VAARVISVVRSLTEVVTERAYDAEARRAREERILDAAADLLQRLGYGRLTMDDVAAQAGIGKGTIYLHWKSREALFQAVLQRELAVLLNELAAAIRADPANALPHRLGRQYFFSIMRRPLLRAFFRMDREIMGKLTRLLRVREVQLSQLRSEFVDLLVEYGVARADLSSKDLTYAYRTIIVGFFLADPTFEDDQPALERKGELLEMILLRALGQDPHPPKQAVRAIADHVLRLFSTATGPDDAAER
jgi:AcrR family transcriptional regulator